jgi:hypothetical protein
MLFLLLGVPLRCQSAEEAEAITALQGIQLVAKLNCPVILERDCQDVVNALNKKMWGRSQASLVYAEASAAAQEISNFKVLKVPRSANAVAHSLAAYSRSVESSGVLNYSAPACVLKQIVLDCNYDIAV